MGLKFKKFRAKLNWKTKDTVPSVVCLRYQIHSEFEDITIPVSSTSGEVATRLQANDVIKQKKLASKPPVQSVFQNATPTSTNVNVFQNATATSTDVNANNVNHNRTTTADQNATPTEPVKPKSILKKSDHDTNLTSASSTEPITLKSEDYNDVLEIDDHKKSALIFMTQTHDYTESEVKDTTTDKMKEVNSQREIDVNFSANENIETIDDKKEAHEASESDLLQEEPNETPEAESAPKSVNWRRTVEYYSDSKSEPERSHLDTQGIPNLETNEPDDLEFKIHFAKCQTISATEYESETEEEPQTEVETYYGNRGAYSSQAASIFFAGEEPEPAPRVRNVKLSDDIDDSAA